MASSASSLVRIAIVAGSEARQIHGLLDDGLHPCRPAFVLAAAAEGEDLIDQRLPALTCGHHLLHIAPGWPPAAQRARAISP